MFIKIKEQIKCYAGLLLDYYELLDYKEFSTGAYCRL